MWTLDKGARLSLKVQQDLTERSKQGVWAHPLCLILVGVTTGLLHRAPMLMWWSMAVAVVQAVVRRMLVTRLMGGPHVRQRRLERAQVGVLLSCAGVWGIVGGRSIFLFGCHDRDVLMMLLYHAVVAFATVNLLVHDRRLIGGAMGLLFVPLIAGHMLSGEPHVLNYLSAAVVYLVYCLVQGRKLNQLYRQQISDNYELSVAAYRDCLTGLPNRLYMEELVESCVDGAEDKRRQIALLYIDLDGFKQINDRHSHKVGDMFLREAATRMRECLRTGDVAARIGGDEFTILLPECASEAEAIGLANRILWGGTRAGAGRRSPVELFDEHRCEFVSADGFKRGAAGAVGG